MLSIMFLNVDGGECFDELAAYLEIQRETIDVFCFQEVLDTPGNTQQNTEVASGHIHHQRPTLYRQLQRILPGHFPFLSQPGRLTSVQFPLYLCNAMFVRFGEKRAIVDVPEDGTIMVGQRRDSMRGKDLATIPRSAQYARLALRGEKTLHVLNFHGLWDADGKHDTPKRIAQAEALRDVIQQKRFDGPLVLGGDFNGFPDSLSASILEKAGLANLVRKFEIPRTRSDLYTRVERGVHADNVFVRGLESVKFPLPEQVAVSDHLPLVVHVDI